MKVSAKFFGMGGVPDVVAVYDPETRRFEITQPESQKRHHASELDDSLELTRAQGAALGEWILKRVAEGRPTSGAKR